MDSMLNFEDYIEYKGRRITLCLDFKTVLNALSILEDKNKAFPVKAVACINLLAPGSNLLLRERMEFLGLVVTCIKEIARKCAPYKHGGGHARLLDFDLDWPAIFAAFYGAYNIDLHESNIHFAKFLMLINNIPRNTRLYEIMALRSSTEPELARLRAVYALVQDEAAVKEHLDNRLQSIFGALKSSGATEKGVRHEKN